MSNHLNDTAETINKFTESVNKAIDNAETNASSNEDKCAAEELKNSTAGKIYSSIVDGAATILKSPNVLNLINKIDREHYTELTELFAVIMIHSSFHAIMVYDEILKGDLEKHDNELNELIMAMMADIKGHDMAIKSIREHLNIQPK